MKTTTLVITSIANDSHPVLRQYALEAKKYNTSLIVIGDTKSPATFDIEGCDFYSIERQIGLGFELTKGLPTKHYARKNVGYLAAIKNGANVIIETDDEGVKREIIIDWIAGVGDDDVVDAVVVEGYYEDNGDEFTAHYTGNEMLNVLRR